MALLNSQLQKLTTKEVHTRTIIIQHLNESPVAKSGKFILKNGEAAIRWRKTSLKERLSRFKYLRKRFNGLQRTHQDLHKRLQKYCYVQYYNQWREEVKKAVTITPNIFVQKVAKRLPKAAQDQLLDEIIHSHDSPSIVSKEDFFANDPIFKGPKTMDSEFITSFSVKWDIMNIARSYKDYLHIPFNDLKHLAEICLMTNKIEELQDYNQKLGAQIAEFLFFRNSPGILSSWTILYAKGPEPITKEEDFIIPILKLYLVGSPDGSIKADPNKCYKKILNILTYHFNPERPRSASYIKHPSWQSLFLMLPYKEPFIKLLDAYLPSEATPLSITTTAADLKLKLEIEGKVSYQETSQFFNCHNTQINAHLHKLLEKLSISQKVALINEFYQTPAGNMQLSALIETNPIGILEHIANFRNILFADTVETNTFKTTFEQFLKSKGF